MNAILFPNGAGNFWKQMMSYWGKINVEKKK